jgi:hypothetical protein
MILLAVPNMALWGRGRGLEGLGPVGLKPHLLVLDVSVKA